MTSIRSALVLAALSAVLAVRGALAQTPAEAPCQIGPSIDDAAPCSPGIGMFDASGIAMLPGGSMATPERLAAFGVDGPSLVTQDGGLTAVASMDRGADLDVEATGSISR